MFYIKMGDLYFRGFAGGETPNGVARWTHQRLLSEFFSQKSGPFGADATVLAITPTGRQITVEES